MLKCLYFDSSTFSCYSNSLGSLNSVIKNHCVLDSKKRFLITAVLKQAEIDLTVPVHL